MATEETAIGQTDGPSTPSKPSWRVEFTTARERAFGLCRRAVENSDNKLLAVGAFLYLSTIGYVHDLVFYGAILGIDILKYTSPEEFAFSVLKHWLLVVAAAISIPVSLLIMVVVETLFRMLTGYSNLVGEREHREFTYPDARFVSLRKYGDATQLASRSAGDVIRSIEPVAENVVLFFILAVRCVIFAIVRILYILYRIALRTVSLAARPVAAVGAVLVIGATVLAPFLVPVGVAYFHTAISPHEEGRLHLRWPNEMIYGAQHLGTPGEYSIFRAPIEGDKNLTDKEKKRLMLIPEENRKRILIVPTASVSSFDVGCAKKTEVIGGSGSDCAPRESVGDDGTKEISDILREHTRMTGEQVRALIATGGSLENAANEISKVLTESTKAVKANSESVKNNSNFVEGNTNAVRNGTDETARHAEALAASTRAVDTNSALVARNTVAVRNGADETARHAEVLAAGTKAVDTNSALVARNTVAVRDGSVEWG